MDRYLVWGTGKGARARCEILEKVGPIRDKVEIVGFVDNNKDKWGGEMFGKAIFSPEDISKIDFDYIAIWSVYRPQIRNQLVYDLNIPEEKIRNVFDPYLDLLEEKYKSDVSSDEEIFKAINFYRENDSLNVFSFEKGGSKNLYEAFYDEAADLYYVMFEGKRMYYKRGSDFINKNGKKYVRDVWYEQNPQSPHLYEYEDVCVREGDVLVDAGTCEGNFTLHHIDEVKKAYLIECDEGWMEALRQTFKPYGDKVVFCECFLGGVDDEKSRYRTLDSLVDESVDFVKMDIEGEEINAIRGGSRLFKAGSGMRCSICTYHRHGDEDAIKDILDGYGFKTSFSKGYMLYHYDEYVIKNPELRHGIIRGIR